MENNTNIQNLNLKRHIKNNSRNLKMKIIDIETNPFHNNRQFSSWQIETETDKNVFLSSDKENNSILNYLTNTKNSDMNVKMATKSLLNECDITKSLKCNSRSSSKNNKSINATRRKTYYNVNDDKTNFFSFNQLGLIIKNTKDISNDKEDLDVESNNIMEYLSEKTNHYFILDEIKLNKLDNVKKIITFLGSKNLTHEFLNCKDEKGNTALHLFVLHNNIDLIKMYLENGAKLDIANKNGETSLFLTIYTFNINLFRFFIVNGANINIQNYKNQNVIDICKLNKSKYSKFLELIDEIIINKKKENTKDYNNNNNVDNVENIYTFKKKKECVSDYGNVNEFKISDTKEIDNTIKTCIIKNSNDSVKDKVEKIKFSDKNKYSLDSLNDTLFENLNSFENKLQNITYRLQIEDYSNSDINNFKNTKKSSKSINRYYKNQEIKFKDSLSSNNGSSNSSHKETNSKDYKKEINYDMKILDSNKSANDSFSNSKYKANSKKIFLETNKPEEFLNKISLNILNTFSSQNSNKKKYDWNNDYKIHIELEKINSIINTNYNQNIIKIENKYNKQFLKKQDEPNEINYEINPCFFNNEVVTFYSKKNEIQTSDFYKNSLIKFLCRKSNSCKLNNNYQFTFDDECKKDPKFLIIKQNKISSSFYHHINDNRVLKGIFKNPINKKSIIKLDLKFSKTIRENFENKPLNSEVSHNVIRIEEEINDKKIRSLKTYDNIFNNKFSNMTTNIDTPIFLSQTNLKDKISNKTIIEESKSLIVSLKETIEASYTKNLHKRTKDIKPQNSYRLESIEISNDSDNLLNSRNSYDHDSTKQLKFILSKIALDVYYDKLIDLGYEDIKWLNHQIKSNKFVDELVSDLNIKILGDKIKLLIAILFYDEIRNHYVMKFDNNNKNSNKYDNQKLEHFYFIKNEIINEIFKDKTSDNIIDNSELKSFLSLNTLSNYLDIFNKHKIHSLCFLKVYFSLNSIFNLNIDYVKDLISLDITKKGHQMKFISIFSN